MNTLIALAIAPLGAGDELAPEVAKVIHVIEQSGLSYKVNSMFTEIEGPWDEVFATVKQATQVLTEQGLRTEVIIKADIRPGFTATMQGKMERLQEQLGAAHDQ